MSQFSRIPLAGAALGLAALGAVATPAVAQDQQTVQLSCLSQPGQRSSCQVNGEVVNAGIAQLRSDVPCIFGYTWGFDEAGLWTGAGCGADFAVTVVSTQGQQQASAETLRQRLKESRRLIRKLRGDLARERDERSAIETELSEAQAQLVNATQKQTKKKRRPDWLVRSIAACSRKASREGKKAGAQSARAAEIMSARATEGKWLIIGRTVTRKNGEREQGYFRCWADEGKVLSYSGGI